MTARGMVWLSRAADDPRACRDEWEQQPDWPQLLGTGRLFDVVAMPLGFGLTVLGQMHRAERCMAGAVVVNELRGRVGFLVGPGSHLAWPDVLSAAGGDPAGAKCFGRGGYLIAPGPLFTPGAPGWWQRGPVGDTDDLTNLQNLADTVAYVAGNANLYGTELASVVGVPGGR